MSDIDRGLVHVNVVKGSAGFAQACRIAAMTLGMAACAQAAVSLDAPLEGRPTLAPTPAALKLQKLLPDQSRAAEQVSPEQKQVLQYGVYPAVKTSVRMNGRTETQWTMHPFDLVRLAREAAAQASRVEGIQVDPAKVGAVMIAESSMVSRVGWSSNGKTPSFGLAQLEERTARALGVKDLNDPRESALAAARLVAEGQKLARMNRGVDPSLVASLAYNTSTSLRTMLIKHYGESLRAEHLPQATQAHVKNMAYGEQRMSQFAKLSDQHEKMARIFVQAPVAPLESSMSIPRPSVMSLVSNLATDNANQARIKHNQLALEKAGHIQVLPMSTQGLNDLRQAVATNIQRLSNAGNPADQSRTIDSAPSALLLSTMGANLESVARSFLEKVRQTFAVIVNDLKTAASTLSPGTVAASKVLAHSDTAAGAAMRLARADMQEQRQRLAALQAHPAFLREADSNA